MKRYLVPTVILMTATVQFVLLPKTVNAYAYQACHRYTVWHYPWAQRCGYSYRGRITARLPRVRVAWANAFQASPVPTIEDVMVKRLTEIGKQRQEEFVKGRKP